MPARPVIALPALAALCLAACGGEAETPELALTITGGETHPDGDACAFDLTGENRLGRDAVNVQLAYSVATNGHGVVSEYVVLGDFAAGETRTGRIFVSGAPCDDVASLGMTRAVCTHMLEGGETESCAEAVTLDGGGIVRMRENAP